MNNLTKNEAGFGIVESILIAFVLVLLGMVGFMVHESHNKTASNSTPKANTTASSFSDNDVVDDLYTLEKALIVYSQESTGGVGMKLPSKLTDLKVQGLKGKLADYAYNYIQQATDGGPTISYKICATFHSRSPKLDDPNYQPYYSYEGPEAYTYHDKGNQCFENAYYKSSSNIKLTSS